MAGRPKRAGPRGGDSGAGRNSPASSGKGGCSADPIGGPATLPWLVDVLATQTPRRPPMIPPRIPPMSTPQVKTRPCRPGDRLWLASVPCGACATIVVADPHPHPASGEANPPPIALTLTVMVPIKDGDIYIITPARSTVHTALGEPLVRDWGTGFADGRYRCKTTGVAGSNVAEIREHLISIGTEALQAVQGVVDAHGASVALWQSEQAAAYAAWPVQDTGEA